MFSFQQCWVDTFCCNLKCMRYAHAYCSSWKGKGHFNFINNLVLYLSVIVNGHITSTDDSRLRSQSIQKALEGSSMVGKNVLKQRTFSGTIWDNARGTGKGEGAVSEWEQDSNWTGEREWKLHRDGEWKWSRAWCKAVGASKIFILLS